MKKYRKHSEQELREQLEKLQEEEVVDDVLCNKCGKSCRSKIWDNVFDKLTIKTTGGYNSYYPDDMVTVEFDLCEYCLKDFVESFKINPRTNNNLI